VPILEERSLKIRTLASAAFVAAAATFALTGVASAQPGDRDCPDFASQAEAQAALDSAVGDPERLDANGDGVACESQFGEESGGSPDEEPAADDAQDEPAQEEPAAEEPSEDEPAAEPAGADDDEQIAIAPRGGVATGDGSGSGSDLPVALVIGSFGAAAVGVAAGAMAPTARRRS
jgi:hypothetical protein